VGITGTTEKDTVVIVAMIMVGDTTEAMTMIEVATVDIIVATMIRGMSAITIVIGTIETINRSDPTSDSS
jgi:hypothetical protein